MRVITENLTLWGGGVGIWKGLSETNYLQCTDVPTCIYIVGYLQIIILKIEWLRSPLNQGLGSSHGLGCMVACSWYRYYI